MKTNNKLSFTIEKIKETLYKENFEISDIESFCGEFYTKSNCQTWCGVVISKKSLLFIVRGINGNNLEYSIKEYESWQTSIIEVEIKNFFKNNEFIKQIPQNEFLKMLPFLI